MALKISQLSRLQSAMTAWKNEVESKKQQAIDEANRLQAVAAAAAETKATTDTTAYKTTVQTLSGNITTLVQSINTTLGEISTLATESNASTTSTIANTKLSSLITKNTSMTTYLNDLVTKKGLLEVAYDGAKKSAGTYASLTTLLGTATTLYNTAITSFNSVASAKSTVENTITTATKKVQDLKTAEVQAVAAAELAAEKTRQDAALAAQIAAAAAEKTRQDNALAAQVAAAAAEKVRQDAALAAEKALKDSELAAHASIISAQAATISTTSTNLNLKVSKDSDTGAASIPSGTTAQRPNSPVNGFMRYNTTLSTMEVYSNGSWGSVGQTPTKSDLGLSNVDNTSDTAKPISTATQTALNSKQDSLVSGTNIKTINGTTVLGSGNISLPAGPTGPQGPTGPTGPQGSTGPMGNTGASFGLSGTVLNVMNTSSINPQTLPETYRIFPNDRERTIPYDYSSDHYGTDRHSMTHMWNTGKITNNNGGVGDASSYMGGNNNWNYKSMMNINWSRYNPMYGAKIIVPANTELVTLECHSGADQIFSLTDVTTGAGVCGTNGSGDNRFYGEHGNSSARALCDGFGNIRHTPYHLPIHLPVPNLTVDREYIINRGCYHRDQSSSGWLSGVSFNKNPRKFITLMGTGVHWYLNGGSTGVGHNSWGWNGHELVYIPQGSGHWVKFPIAPGAGGRMIFIICHGEGHPQELESVQINGKRKSLRGAHPSSPAFQMMVSTSNYHRVDEVYVSESDIPLAVLSNGGFLDVYMDNERFGNHHYYFSTIGSYLPNIVVRDKEFTGV